MAVPQRSGRGSCYLSPEVRNALIVGAGIAVAAVLFLALRPNDGSDAENATTTTSTITAAPRQPPQPPQPTSVRIVVRDGKPVDGIRNVTVAKGQRVVLVVTSDVPDEIHLHGYDLTRDIAAGETVRLPFNATIVGTVEVELESRDLPLARITTRS